MLKCTVCLLKSKVNLSFQDEFYQVNGTLFENTFIVFYFTISLKETKLPTYYSHF